MRSLNKSLEKKKRVFSVSSSSSSSSPSCPSSPLPFFLYASTSSLFHLPFFSNYTAHNNNNHHNIDIICTTFYIMELVLAYILFRQKPSSLIHLFMSHRIIWKLNSLWFVCTRVAEILCTYNLARQQDHSLNNIHLMMNIPSTTAHSYICPLIYSSALTTVSSPARHSNNNAMTTLSLAIYDPIYSSH